MVSCAEVLSPSIAALFNKSLSQGEIPDAWREAIVIPIHKKSSKSDPKNYRPVSLTSSVCKLLENIVRQQLQTHLNRHNLLIDNQHGFRSKRSCETQLISSLNDWCKALENKQNIDIIYLDISHAFDCVPYNRLLTKLYNIGIKGNLLGWFRSFLKGRKQKVRVNNSYSKWIPVTSGVPQGTILGTLLFLIYINNITDSLNCTCRLFADDCILYKSYSDQKETDSLQEDLNKLGNWSDKWLLSFNPSKCKVMHISNKNSRIKRDYFLNDNKLENVDCEKYLGVYIQIRLNWSQHTNYLCQDSYKKLGMLKRVFSNCDTSIKENLYNQLIRSKIDYASSVWDPYTLTSQRKLEKVQKRAYRFICKSDIPNYTFFIESHKILALHQLRKWNRLCMLFKIINNKVDIEFENNLTWALPSGRKLRKKNNYQLSQNLIRIDILKFSFYPRTINEWNKLPNSVVSAPSFSIFKLKLYEHLLKSHDTNCKICYDL